MYLSEEQIQAYESTGYLFLQQCFSQEEINIVKAELPGLFAEDSPRRVLEKNSDIVRSIYGSHMTNEIAYRISRHPRIVEPARQILRGDVYIYQFKINAKAAFGGDVWSWH